MYGPAITQTGYRVVGSYEKKGQTNANGFVYDSTTKKYLTLDAPANLCAPKSCNYTIVHSNYGNATYKAVGNYDAVKSGSTREPFGYVSGFGTCLHLRFGHRTFSTLEFPGSVSSTAYGIWMDGKHRRHRRRLHRQERHARVRAQPRRNQDARLRLAEVDPHPLRRDHRSGRTRATTT